MEWYIYTIGAAVSAVFFQVFRKKALQKTHAMNFESVRTLFVFLISLFLIPFIDWSFDKTHLIFVYTASVLIALGIIFAAKAYRHKDISLINPLSSLRPAFVVIIAFFLLSEKLALNHIIGILILLASSYILETDHKFKNLIAPIRYIKESRHVLFFILAMLLFAAASVMDKFIIDMKIPNFFTYYFFLWLFVAFNLNLIHYFFYGFEDSILCLKQTTYLPLIVAFFSLIANLLIFKALTMQNVSIVRPILLLSTIGVVIFGGRYFHEKNILFRVIVSLFMLFGAYLIII